MSNIQAPASLTKPARKSKPKAADLAGRGRPPLFSGASMRTLTLKFPDTLIALVAKAATAQGVSASEIVRRAVQESLNKPKQ